jgi:predicted permease
VRPWGIKRVFSFASRTNDEVRGDIADEVAFHLDMRTDELKREGLSESDARARAMREFGGREPGMRALEQIDCRVERRRGLVRLLSELRRDIAIGLRLLRRNPGFAAIAILTLALGIGANTAIYSVFDAVLLRPLPYPEPDRLLMVSETQENGSANNVAGGVYLDWRTHQTKFDALTLVGQVTYNLRGNGPPERLAGLEVSHEFLQVLGTPTLLGRGFLPDDDRPGGHNDVVIITEELWRSHFGGDHSIVGRTIVLDQVPRTIIGVLPAGTWLFREHAFLVPAVLTPGTPRAARAPHWAAVFGRLAPGATVTEANTELRAIRRQLVKEYPTFKQRWGVVATPVTEVLGGVTRTPMLVLLLAVSIVLLIACANVANLVLARSCHRQQELAVRAALGASGGRLVRQVLTENLTLAILGGVAGLAVACGGVVLLRTIAAAVMPIAFTPALDLRVLMFSFAITMATGPLFGLLPALRSRRPDLNATLNSGSRGSTAAGHQRTQATLVAIEVALTVVLLSSAGLLLRSLANAASVDPGFEPARVLAFDVSMPRVSYPTPEKQLAFATTLLDRLRALPGVDAAGTGMAIPFAGGGYGEFFRRPGAREADQVVGRFDYVSPGYLEALGTRLLAGRRFTGADNRANGPRVVVISDTTARTFLRGQPAVGQSLEIAGGEWQVVGVIDDVVDRRLDAVRGAFAYAPQAFDTSSFSVAVRTHLQPMTLVASIQREMQQLDPGVALARPRALDRAMAESMMQRKVVLGLIGVFAFAALALATVGLYGVMAYAVATRQREFGIRIAFGAVRRDLVSQVLRAGLRMMGIGLVLGLAGTLGAAQLLSSQLFQVGGGDPVVIGTVTLTVIAVAVFACWVPAWRASRYDPVVALRAE